MQKEIDLRVLFNVLRKRLLLIIFISGVMACLGGLYSLFSTAPPPIYQSSASILLNSYESDAANTFEVILRDPAVLESVTNELGITKTVQEMNNQIAFSNDGGSKIVKIIVSDMNPELAAKIANATADLFIKQVGNVLGIYDARIYSEASPSVNPAIVESGPSLLKFIVLGFGGGFVLSIGLVLFLDSLDNSIKSEQEIERLLGFPVIGSVSKMNKENMKSIPGKKKKILKS